jgi:predicted house-cleaning NTP pyrophosphatase (Maf/HAM1 superfamily)
LEQGPRLKKYGAREKADDVPARLSKNEFVFTADAVRAAGGGSVQKGAQKMYNTMKQLEAMGKA